jgi:hypothetical protein
MNIGDRLHLLTTYIEVTHIIWWFAEINNASGFFYQILSPRDPSKDWQWLSVESLWLVTNRHVVYEKDMDWKEVLLPKSLSFKIRYIDNNNQIDWEDIILNIWEIKKRIKESNNEKIDIVAINLLDIFTEKVQKKDKKYTSFCAVSEHDIPWTSEINMDVWSDVLILWHQ